VIIIMSLPVFSMNLNAKTWLLTMGLPINHAVDATSHSILYQ